VVSFLVIVIKKSREGGDLEDNVVRHFRGEV